MSPKGKEADGSLPLPVRVFDARLRKLEALLSVNETSLIEKTKNTILNDVRSLPSNNVIILDGKRHLDAVLDESFWLR